MSKSPENVLHTSSLGIETVRHKKRMAGEEYITVKGTVRDAKSVESHGEL